MRIIAALFVLAGIMFAQMDPWLALKAEEADLQAKLGELRIKYTENYTGVKDLKTKLARIQEELAALRGEGYPPDMWWTKPDYVRVLGIAPDQVTRISEIFQQYRLKLLDLNLALQKEEIALEPLVATTPLNESKAIAQIDRVAQARAELEKARGRMLLGMRKVLTEEQWQKLNSLSK